MLRRARTSLVGEHRRKQVLYNTFSKDRALGLMTYVVSAGSTVAVAYSMGLRSVEQYLRGYDKDVAFELGKWIIRKRDAFFGVITPEEAFERAPGVKRIEPYGRALRGD
mmetsp:Transcript_15013/g.47883  ORF Transcript_15013/g.47883 Transcript_15013/m.47883 type:complete len:109 (-) Transcript_15013:8-334(-)